MQQKYISILDIDDKNSLNIDYWYFVTYYNIFYEIKYYSSFLG